jgi:deoxyribonuclease V
MKDLPSIIQDWPTNAADAVAAQKALRSRLRIEDDYTKLEIIAGVDVGYDIVHNISYAVIVTMDLGRLQPLETRRANLPTIFPYIPGLLSFREIPVILEGLRGLKTTPDLLMVDGQGIAHPRRLGIAAHLGVLTDIPAIGVAKSLLTGRYEEPGPHKGDSSPLLDHKTHEKIGTVLRSKEKVKPLFISSGHGVSHETAIRLTLQCLIKHRLPEPTRIADKISKIKPEMKLL